MRWARAAGSARTAPRSAAWPGVAILASAALLAATPGGARAGSPAGVSFQKGMTLGIFSKTDPDYFRTSLAEIRALGANSVSLLVPKVQKDVRSVGFYDDPWVTPTDQSLRLASREARRQGMQVFLFPIVYVEELADGEWRGTIDPPDWDAWFAEYERMILHYARLAASEKIEYFAVGSELCSTERFRERWRRVIGKVRGVYGGKLTYSANWDHLEPVSFGTDLDFLGMNAYYEVGKGNSSEVGRMVERWKEIQKGIRAWRAANANKPIVITEIGYPSRQGAGVDPWNYFGEGEADSEEQRKCYEAFVRAWKDETMLAGVYFYLWWGEGGPSDRDYTPRGKGAERVIAAYFVGEASGGGHRPPGEVGRR